VIKWVVFCFCQVLNSDIFLTVCPVKQVCVAWSVWVSGKLAGDQSITVSVFQDLIEIIYQNASSAGAK